MPLVFAAVDFASLPEQVVNGLLLGAIYALVALGYTMVYGVLKLINFAHSEVFMLGAYAALFTSWGLGFIGDSQPHASVKVLLLMLLASVVACGIVGALIERFAYRPLRNQPRIASLITAIGLSLLLQYGGQIFLPANQAISDKTNLFPGTSVVVLKQGTGKADTAPLKQAVAETTVAYEAQLKHEKDRFNLSSQGQALRDAKFAAERQLRDAENRADQGRVQVALQHSKLVAFGVTAVLMVLLTYLVLYTKTGRAMRAVSHDFDAAGLMGINVGRIVTITFVLGSMLAGAAAMMIASLVFPGTKIDPFFGALFGIKAFVAAVLGGIGNIPGAVLGGLLMGVTESLVQWAGYPGYKDAVAFVVLILVLIVRPGGLLGSAKVEKV